MRPLLGLTVFLLATPLFLVGCGKKTPPVPPESAVPAQVSDLRSDLDPTGVTLKWSWPRKTEKGAGLRRVSEFIVERADDRPRISALTVPCAIIASPLSRAAPCRSSPRGRA